ncbi:ABC exporter membrane fusion protein [Microcoleus sp. FACHB-SPT15]|uniref:ABC exporter membrane fusion protein n=1 Tax=Microcoleus sp. FACHB-SPT15 TaxID=2692830 RepID=UPI00178163BB|nr:ABC exporter membrane fusion protein [Microcoleus sp. FACHB-SPT15]MBD1808986.1 ABC exporter membrane fusion protein [Microcoleus sp. FACHB-SPT15]
MLNQSIASGSPSSQTQTRNPRWIRLAVATMLLVGGVGAYTIRQFQSSQAETTQTEVSVPEVKTVTALGRLEPKGEVIKLSAPTSSQENRVEQLLVKEGDRIKAGQVIAILDSRDRLQAALEEAEEQVRVAQAKLAITQAGSKRGEVEAQRAEIARLEAERQGDVDAQAAMVSRLESQRRNAQIEYNRYQSLYQQGAISASERDSKHLTLDTAEQSLQEAQAELNRTRSTSPQELNKARATLNQIAEVRPVDVEADRVEVRRAIASMKQAKANLDEAYVRSPQDGVVMDIHTRAGEVVSDDGIAEIGQTKQMVAVAEVYQSDVSKVRPGQQVRVTSDSIPGELQGTVERVGSQVRRQEIVNTDPSTNIDSRVVEVHVALNDSASQKAAKFTNLQVKVEIEL